MATGRILRGILGLFMVLTLVLLPGGGQQRTAAATRQARTGGAAWLGSSARSAGDASRQASQGRLEG
jgi:hypothetical protein